MESDDRHLSSGVNIGNTVILFIFFGLFLGQIVKHICNTVKFPYTPVLA